MDRRTFLTSTLGGGLAVAAGPRFGRAATDGLPVDLELVMAIDVSGSVDQVEGQLQRQGYIDAFRLAEIQSAIQDGPMGRIAVMYVEWGGEYYQRTVVNWTLLRDAASCNAFADQLERLPVSSELRTSISAAIDYAHVRFGRGFEGTRRVIDISGDGVNNAGRSVLDAREDALSDGIVINGLPIVNDRPNRGGGPPPPDLDKYYESSVIGGPGCFMVVAEDFETFGQAIRAKLIKEIAALPAGEIRTG